MPQETIYLLTLCLPLATILIVCGMRYFAMIQQAKARAASDDAYRKVAERSVAVQSETAAALSSVRTALAEIQSRLAAVEKVLTAVE
jgi:hypothetical protein